MKNIFWIGTLAAVVSMPAAASSNLQPYKGLDLSGTYTCSGRDARDGDFKATVTLTLDKNNSHAAYAAYRFKMDADGYGLYTGSAAGSGNMLAITFANSDASKNDYGTGIAKVFKEKNGKLRFEKFYYEPEYKKEGSHGFESCTRN